MPPRVLLLAGLAVGCGAAGSGPLAPVPAVEECLLRSGEVTRPHTLLAAADGRDTLLLASARRHTPLGLSCTGRPLPRVASAWSADSSRTTWTLVLPAAAELATRWRERPEAVAVLRLAGVTAVLPIDERRLAVSFRSAQDTVPQLFADPALAAASGAADRPSLQILPSTGPDLRDALDRGADIVVTADPAVLDYAATRPGLTPHALPWNRTYVLLAPGRPVPIGFGGDSAGFRQALARDAVRVAARGAEPPFWWEETAGCARAPARLGPPVPAVVYPRGDPVARALAERIVAMAEARGTVARGVPDGELAAAIAGGAASGYVVSLPRVALVPCRELAAWPAGASALPLIDTRPTAVLAAGIPPLLVEYDGGLLPAERP